MRSTRSVVLLLVALAACQPAAPPAPTFTPADEAAVRKNLDDYPTLTLAKNWDAIIAMYTTDAVRFAPNEPMVDHHSMKAWIEAYPPISAFATKTEHLEGNGTLAVARGTYTITLNIPGQKAPVNDKGKWMVVLKKQADGSWKRTLDGWNSDNPLPKS
jgi:ketosteroid isomerase-like protein